MIPHGRTAITGAQAAEIMGLNPKTFRNRGVARQAGAPKPLTVPGRKTPLWDRAQWEAYAAGRELPVWKVGTGGHPLDRLDTIEAAELLGVEPDTLHRYRAEGRLAGVDVCGVPHYWRGELEYRRDNPGAPGRPRKAG
ncbi:hypothetical protein GCM10009555_017200 [Acrocarpospora macrocephala]|uniref:Uncharacterized protein n=1 Tax=Acrocarpospora macrocephala TaxID=150177 RepID=A0A5M3WGG4_9ACTN|nr:helix-turn-helix domain-containing protein [Acrocarpospora macrocephala]GES07380.1 hypothetical protein Amac_009750 [Acrocarpospora macrocephala]